MPKRRGRASADGGGGSVGGGYAGSVAEAVVGGGVTASGGAFALGLDESAVAVVPDEEGGGVLVAPIAAEEAPPRDREIVLRDGADGRLSRPLQRSQGEVERFNDLWGRYDRGDELTPEERGELYEYLRRRMVLPARRLDSAAYGDDEAAAREAARSFAVRYGQLERFVSSDLPESGDEALEPYRERAALARALAAGETAATQDLTPGDLRAVTRFQTQNLSRARTELMGAAAAAQNYRDVLVKYVEQEKRLAEARETLAEYERRGITAPAELEREVRLAEQWAESARETADVLRAREGPLNIVSPERRNGFTVGRRAVALPEPPSPERRATPEMRAAAARIYISLPENAQNSRLAGHLRELGVSFGPPSGVPANTVNINWGHGGVMPEGVLNRDVSGTSDKVEMLRRLGGLAPRSTFNAQEAARLFGGRVAAKRAFGSRGEGKAVLDLTTDEGRRRAYEYDFFQEFIPERDEYRVTLFGDEVLTAHRKNAFPGSDPENLAPERAYERVRRMPVEAIEAAKEARRRCSVDLAGVDLIRDRRDGRWYVLEVNAAPGMGQDTLARLVEVVGSMGDADTRQRAS